jgi:PLP dependent protein
VEGVTATPDAFAQRLAAVRDRIGSAGGDASSIRIVAVTKGFGVGAVDQAVSAGLSDVGENYAQELLAKSESVSPDPRWHFLGRIQTNKVRRLAPLVTVWHGVDRLAAAEAIAGAGAGAEVLVQVNVAGIQSKNGCRPDQVDDLVGRCRDMPLDLSGLMAVGPEGDLAASRQCFRWLAEKAAQLGLRELSMGMSDDFEVAVQEGATTLRLGRVLFGPRPEQKKQQR